MMKPLTGKVKWYCDRVCYGLITPDDGSEDIIVHKWSIHSKGYPSLDDGEPVEFKIAEYKIRSINMTRKRAVEVTSPSGAAVQGNDCSGGRLGNHISCKEYGYFHWDCPQYDGGSTCTNCGGSSCGDSVIIRRARCVKCIEGRHVCEVRITGTVSWYCPHRGYGFIAPDDGSEDVFVHLTGICCLGFPTLSVGDAVEFQFAVDDRNRKKAFDVRAPGGGPLKGSNEPVQSKRK